jgi:alkylation response protein AidB-like acyl-CoA dehydrogenase
MDFSLTDEQQAVRDLGKRILSDNVTQEALRAVEASDRPGFDASLWSRLSEAGLLGIAVPEEQGGLGLGFLELCQLLEEVGRTVAPVPALAGLAYGALPLSRHGTPEQKGRLLPSAATGRTLLTAALVEPLGDPLRPTTTARADGDGWVLDGLKTCVPAGLYADRILVSAASDDGPGLFIVDPTAAGVTRDRQDTISYAPEALLTLDGVRVPAGDRVGAADPGALEDTVTHVTAAICAVMTGVTDAAVRLAATYTATREQFGRPLAMFQAVGQRAADAYVDTQAVRLTTLQAVWRLSDGRPAAKEVAVAKYYASEAGQRVVRAATHLHGGMGVSREYPLHRYYIWAKQLELTLGSGTRQLAALGRLLADEPVEV